MVVEVFGGLRYEHDKFLCLHRTDVAVSQQCGTVLMRLRILTAWIGKVASHLRMVALITCPLLHTAVIEN